MRLRKPGFTLVELLFVLAIIALLATLALPALDGFVRDRRLLTAAEDIRNLLREARRNAMVHHLTYRVGYDPSREILELVPRDDKAADQVTPPAKAAQSEESADLPPRKHSPLMPGYSLATKSEFKKYARSRDKRLSTSTKEEESKDSQATEPEELVNKEEGEQRKSGSSEEEQDLFQKLADFYPDGSSDDREFVLLGPENNYIDISIDGLLGEINLSGIQWLTFDEDEDQNKDRPEDSFEEKP